MATTTLAQVAIPQVAGMSVIDFGLSLAGVVVFLYFIYKAWTERARTPAAPYVGTPYIAITMVLMTIAVIGDSVALNMYSSYFAMAFGFLLKVAMYVLIWPFWLAGLLIIPFAHIGPKLKEAFNKAY